MESHLFSKSHFDRIDKSVEAHSYHFTPIDSFKDNVTDTGHDSDLVADIDTDILVRIVLSELKQGKAPGLDKVYNDTLKKAIGICFLCTFGSSLDLIVKTRFYPLCLEGGRPLYAHQA